MPLRDYRCQKCNHTEEILEPVNAPDKRKCEKCGSVMERKVTASNFKFPKKKDW